jgi:hypothetical protein
MKQQPTTHSAVSHLMKQETMNIVLRYISDHIIGTHSSEYSYFSLSDGDKIICNGMCEIKECVKFMMFNNINFTKVEEIVIPDIYDCHVGIYEIMCLNGQSKTVMIKLVDAADKVDFKNWHIIMMS